MSKNGKDKQTSFVFADELVELEVSDEEWEGLLGNIDKKLTPKKECECWAASEKPGQMHMMYCKLYRKYY